MLEKSHCIDKSYTKTQPNASRVPQSLLSQMPAGYHSLFSAHLTWLEWKQVFLKEKVNSHLRPPPDSAGTGWD